MLLDRDGTIAKAIEAIDEAADAGASLPHQSGGQRKAF